MFIAPFDTKFFRQISNLERFGNRCRFKKNMIMAVKNVYDSPLSKGYDGSKTKINLAGTYYGKNWNESDQAHWDLYLKSLETDQNLALLEDERAYNSPLAQAQRLHAAGLNPDLQNISPDDSPHVQSSAPTAPQGHSRMDDVSKVANIAQTFLTSLPEVIGMYTNVKSQMQQMQSNSLDMAGKYDSIALNILSNALPKEVFSKDKNGHEFLRGYDPSIDIARYLGPKASRSMTKRVSSAVNRYLSGNLETLRGEIYNRYGSAESRRQGLLSLLGSYGFNVDDDVFVETVKEFNNIVQESLKNKGKYERDYYSSRSGTSTGTNDQNMSNKKGLQAENNVFAKTMARANKLMNSDSWSDQLKGIFMYIGMVVAQSKLGGEIL